MIWLMCDVLGMGVQDYVLLQSKDEEDSEWKRRWIAHLKERKRKTV
jgi:hypothetical protein